MSPLVRSGVSDAGMTVRRPNGGVTEVDSTRATHPMDGCSSADEDRAQ